MTCRVLSGPPSCINLPPSPSPPTSHRCEAELADQLVEISAASAVCVTGVEHDLAAVGVARIGSGEMWRTSR